MDIIKTLEDEQLRENKFDFHVGDTVKVDYLIKEGNKERVQVYEGTVIKMQGTGLRRTFTVRISLRCRSRKNFLNQLTKSN